MAVAPLDVDPAGAAPGGPELVAPAAVAVGAVFEPAQPTTNAVNQRNRRMRRIVARSRR
jgi:hypothetical protein